MNAGLGPLISVDELARLLETDAPVVVVDLRWYLGQPGVGRDAYRAGHIPGAIFLDLDDDLSDPGGLGAPGRHPLPSPERFVAHVADVGIGDGMRVVAYDDAGGWVAARLWWMLEDLGFGRRGTPGEAIQVLDGGIAAWATSGRTLASGEERRPSATLGLRGPWRRVVEREALKDRLGSVLLLDARAAPRYRGEIEPVDPVPGHIPTAVSAPYDGNLAGDGSLLPAGVLRDRFAELGAGDRQVVTSCGSGTSACHHALAMRVAGLPDPILYVGSYSEWSRAGEPVATGAEPGAYVRQEKEDR